MLDTETAFNSLRIRLPILLKCHVNCTMLTKHKVMLTQWNVEIRPSDDISHVIKKGILIITTHGIPLKSITNGTVLYLPSSMNGICERTGIYVISSNAPSVASKNGIAARTVSPKLTLEIFVAA